MKTKPFQSYEDRRKMLSGMTNEEINELKLKRRTDRLLELDSSGALSVLDKKIHDVKKEMLTKSADIDNQLDDISDHSLNYIMQFMREIKNLEIDLSNLETLKTALFPK